MKIRDMGMNSNSIVTIVYGVVKTHTKSSTSIRSFTLIVSSTPNNCFVIRITFVAASNVKTVELHNLVTSYQV